MQSSGDNLSIPRKIDFTVVVFGESEAKQFKAQMERLGYEAVYRRTDCVPELPWDVEVRIFMVPNHAEITAIEETLQSVADPLGGRNDGWGCFEVGNRN
jgi:hypothetical protein